MANFALTPADVERLLTDASDEARAATAQKVSVDIEKDSLTSAERKLAKEIMQILAKDAALVVRSAVADSMKHSAHLPPELAEQLASDIEQIALPILENSPVLSDAFLIRVIREQPGAPQVAIAGRAHLPDAVVTTLVEIGEEAAVARVMANPTAEVAEHNIAYALERFPASDAVAQGVAERPQVPAHILEYLVNAASETLRDKIRTRADYRPQMDEVVTQARERATLRMLGRTRPDAELEEVARQLIESQRLTASLALRTLCLGDMRFFEICMAQAAKVPLKNARALIHDQGVAGLQALYTRSGLPKNFLPAIQHALEVAEETSLDGGPDDLARYRRRLIERILTQPQGMTAEDVEYLLSRLSDLEVTAA